jgi:hypothetical protein
MKTVGDLIKVLSELDPNLIVGLASDEEGTRMDTWSGDVSFTKYNPDNWERMFTTWIDVDDDDMNSIEETAVTAETADSIVIWP